jgi:hypothetical protein
MPDDVGDLQQLAQLMYADEPGHVRLAGDPWVSVAKVVERALVVLEDGQRKLAEIWRSPAGTAYLAEMGRVVDAMRATSEVARHNDQVMSAAADALEAKQKDFAVLAAAPIPEDARERYAQAIVKSLDEDYQQAVANFHGVPTFSPSFEEERPLATDRQGLSSSSGGRIGSTSTPSPTQAETPKQLPQWVPSPSREQVSQVSTQGDSRGPAPADDTTSGPALQGVGGHSPATPTVGAWPSGDAPRPGASFGHVPAWPSDALTGGTFQPGWRDGAGQPSTRRTAFPPRGSARLVAPEPDGSRGVPTSGRIPATGQPGSVVGGVPVGGSGGSRSRPWSGYRRPPEAFPISPQHAVPPVIAPAGSDEPEPAEVATDYVDDLGNRITIRRPHD